VPTERLLDYAGPAFRAARVRAGVTQAELAERAGVSTATISRIENARAWPSNAHVDRVVDAYATASGLTPLELLEQMVAAWRADEYDEGASILSPRSSD
jgi:transcriptional regulator with XRE-family HTH domain